LYNKVEAKLKNLTELRNKVVSPRRGLNITLHNNSPISFTIKDFLILEENTLLKEVLKHQVGTRNLNNFLWSTEKLMRFKLHELNLTEILLVSRLGLITQKFCN
jgi:hypothetical protein